MLEFYIDYTAQQLPGWLSDAIDNATVIVLGDSVSDVQYFLVDGRTAGPGDTLVNDGESIYIK